MSTLSQVASLQAALEREGVLAAVDAALASWLPSPTDAAKSANAKIVKDRVWGIVELDGWVLPFVDSRLLQRQRRIRQLGLSDLVFPGAGYSRFEHALGCFHVMKRLVDAVKSHSTDLACDARDRQALLLAALLHDVGHMPFSHATEKEVDARTEHYTLGSKALKDVKAIFCRTVGKIVPSAEMLSVLAVLSTPMRALFAKAFDLIDPSKYVQRVAAFIAGVPPSDELRGWAQLVSGVCDADKLDYMSRDALVSGVPVSVDVPRLLAQCRIDRVEALTLPPSRAHTIKAGTIFLTSQSGNNALEELTVSRFILHDRVYNHHKARAAEAILGRLLDEGRAGSVLPPDLLRIWLMTDDAVLLAAQNHQTTQRVAEKLLYRELPRRALVYGDRLFDLAALPRTNADRSVLDDSLKSLRGRFVASIDETFEDPDSRAAFVTLVETRARQFAAWIGEPPKGEPGVVVWPRPAPPFATFTAALVKDVDDRVHEFRSFMPISEWGDAYSLNKRFGYIFCEEPWRPLVHLAAELALWEHIEHPRTERQHDSSEPALEYQPRLSSDAASRVKLSSPKLDELRRVLDAKSAYRNARPLRPLGIDSLRCERIAKRLASFDGADEWRVTAASVAAFVRQFPCTLQDAISSKLEELTIIDRSSLGTMVTPTIIATNQSARGMILALSPNSGAFTRWLLQQELQKKLPEGWRFTGDALDTVIEGADGIVLLDDLVSSGSQATVQLQAWMGVAREQWLDPNEQNVATAPLSEASRERLKKQRVTMVFAHGHRSAKTAIEGAAKTLGLDVRVDIVNDLASTETGSSDVLHQELRRVGEQLLVGRASATTDALGYGGRTGWITGLFNVPTCCPVALWMPGTVDEHPWLPLLVRRGYQQRAVFG